MKRSKIKMFKNRLRNLIILGILLCTIMIAFKINSTSKSEPIITTNLIYVDSLSNEQVEFTINTDDYDNGYYYILPSNINGFEVEKYFLQTNENIDNTQNLQNTENIENDSSKKYFLPGEKYYFTEEEINSLKTVLNVVYNTKEIENQKLYYKVLENTLENSNIKIEGYMPKNSEISIKMANFKEVEDKIKKADDTLSLNVAYDIKILSSGQKYEPNEFDENVKITVSGLIDKENTVGLKVIHIDDEDKIEEIKSVSIEEENLLFNTESFSVFAIVSPSVTYSNVNELWNGGIADSFALGNGEQNSPYLISTGAELAYLRARVNSGEQYRGKYFKLTNDIDLNNNVWIPIGTASTSFAGNFDGQGYTISNTVISANGTGNQIHAYGIFASIEGNENNDAIIKNVVFDNIQINITFPSNDLNNNIGYKIGIVSGAMYRYTKIENVIVRNSRISNNSWTNISYNARPSVFVGGIVGEAAYSATSSLTQVTSGKYVINNCFSDVDINIEVYSSSQECSSRLAFGGIIGSIAWHSTWPTSCLYTGSIGGNSSTAMVGPIFGRETSRDYDIVNNFVDLAYMWEGNNDLTMTSYYTNYIAKGTNYTSTITHGDTPNDSQYRATPNPDWFGHVSGVNKGIYTTQLNTTILNMFNENARNSNYSNWSYENSTYYLQPKINLVVTEDETTPYKFTVTPEYIEENVNYSYKWYINNQLDNTITGNTADFELSFVASRKIQVLVSNGQNASLVQFTLEKLTLGVEIVENGNVLTPQFTGEGASLASFDEFDINWYEIDVIEGKKDIIANSKNLSEAQNNHEYLIELTNGYEGMESLSATYYIGQRNVVFVNNIQYNINGTNYVGNNNNSGNSPENAVNTLERAYQLINSNGTIENNIIVIMGNYNNTDYLDVRGSNIDSYNSAMQKFNKSALVTGKYQGVSYNANLNFSSEDNTYNGKYLFADTRFEYITFNGNNRRTFFYLQGHNIILGSGIVMTNYENMDGSDFGHIKGLETPNFSMFCGFHNYNYSTIPNESKVCNVLIKSGTYGRVIAGGRCNSGAEGNLQNSHNIYGSLNDYFTANITIDYINQTTSNTPDINLLVAGATDGNIYTNSTLNVNSGKIARILGGNIGSNVIMFNGYPVNMFVGSTTININGGDISEIYGTSLGRWSDTIYYYGDVEINISGGIIRNALYGAGAASITGHNSDNAYEYYLAYAQGIDTNIEINISGGEIIGNIYGAGYGYSSYLENSVRNDGGSLYGNSSINISGGNISGNIYGAGRGYNYTDKTKLAQMIGDSTITITGNPNITGTIYGAGEGINGSEGIAQLIGKSTINIDASLSSIIFGGGSVAKVTGDTNININSGTNTGIIYGGGNRGDVLGDASVVINDGTISSVYGGGNESNVLNARVTSNGGNIENLYGGGNLSYAIEGEVIINNGNITNVYGGGNESGADATIVYVKNGTVGRVFGGSNNSGEIAQTTVIVENGTISEVYGGNNEGGKTTESTVIIYGGNIANVYGGGNNVDTHITNVYLRNSTQKVGNIFGGGNNAGAYQTNVYAEGGEAENVYGGSNNSGSVVESTVYVGDDGEENDDNEVKETYDGSYDFYIEEEVDDVEYVEGYVAYMNGTYYETLQNAIDDINETSQVKIVLIDNTKETINISEEKNIKLNLNGKTLSSDDTTINLRGKLTITDTSIRTLGKIETTGPTNACYPLLQYGGELVINKGIIKSNFRGIRTYDNARVIVNGGNITASGGSGIGFESDGYFEMNGGIVLGNSHGFYTSEQVEVIVTGGKIFGNTNGLFYAGNIPVTLGKKDGVISEVPLITGGQTGLNAQNVSTNYYDGVLRGTGSAISGNIGEIENGSSIQNSTQIIEAKNYNIINLAAGVRMFSVRRMVAAVDYAAYMNNSYYDTLQSAINAANNEEVTIKILKDIQESVNIPTEKNIILDLNGYTITSSNTTFTLYGKLTIEDNSELKTGRIVTTGSSNSYYPIIQYGGQLVINEGSITSNYRGIAAFQNARIIINGGSITANSGSAITFEENGYFEMNGGTVYGSSNGFYTNSEVQIMMLGGYISGNTNGINNGGNTAIIIGKKDGMVRKTPIISGGQTGLRNTGTVINFYDGIIRGTGSAVEGGFADLEKASVVQNSREVINGVEYNVVTLFGSSLPDISVDLPTANFIRIDNIYGGNNLGGLTTLSNIFTYSGNITNIFGGGNRVNATTTNIQVIDGKITNIHGGSNQLGNVNKSNILIKGGTTTNIFGGNNEGGTTNNSNINVKKGEIINVYGGNNLGGTTVNANIQTNGGEITNVYGGGNQAATNVSNLKIRSNILGSVYGGGNQAAVNTNTNINLINAVVGINVYGGGNEGVVLGNTYLNVTDSEILGSVYAGGNGITAIVSGNTNVLLEGHTIIQKHVFGGGNQAATGSKEINNSLSIVNIVGGIIGGNVYGGANTSVVYGITNVNIGKSVANIDQYKKSDINISGTVFGGGEANEAGDENYDFSFVSVTQGTNVNIDADTYSQLTIGKSIFGSGNASTTTGPSIININNYGTYNYPKTNVSIQRANTVTLNNCAIWLAGATDRTNEHSNVLFSLSRIDELKVKNNSTLYLQNGTNLVKKLSSIVDTSSGEEKGKVTINENGIVDKNVDNRIYIREGVNINIAENEQANVYGDIYGMFFLGLYTGKNQVSLGLYSKSYEHGEELDVNDRLIFTKNSYLLGEHYETHDITIDGFYSNFKDEDNIIKTNYINPTPTDQIYYIWNVGELADAVIYEIDLTASKYNTLGTKELQLLGFGTPNTVFEYVGTTFDLLEGVNLVDKNIIKNVEEDNQKANSNFGLSIETGRNGWNMIGKTSFYTTQPHYSGVTTYLSENSNITPTLNFYLYHSQNLTEEKELGEVVIAFTAIQQKDDLNKEIKNILIYVGLDTALYQDSFYESAITPGEKYELFTNTQTNITSKSEFSQYYSLLIHDFSQSDYYAYHENSYRTLVSSKVLPVNTTITMIDMMANSTEYYYYKVTQEDNNNNKTQYNIADFKRMGSTEEYYIEDNSRYYNSELDIEHEEFIFHYDFSNADITDNIENETILLEYRSDENETLIGVLGDLREQLQYGIYEAGSNITVNASTPKSSVYLGQDLLFNVETNYNQTIINNKIIYDTNYFGQKLGLKITFFDSNGDQVTGSSLLGVHFELNGRKYYPRTDGTTRINTAGNVSNVASNIKVITENSNLASGNYNVKIEAFASPDGIYYGLESADEESVELVVLNSIYGLKVNLEENMVIINSETGLTQNNNNNLKFNIEYSSGIVSPNIKVGLYRRDYGNVYSNIYNLVDLQDYVTNELTTTDINDIYLVTDNPKENFDFDLILNEELITGTYKVVFSIYDNDVYIGEVYEYIIIN